MNRNGILLSDHNPFCLPELEKATVDTFDIFTKNPKRFIKSKKQNNMPEINKHVILSLYERFGFRGI